MGFLLGFLGVVAGIIFLLLLLYFYLIYHFNKMGFKGINILKIKKEIENNTSNSPKQISGMTSVLLPKIMDDFPDFNIDLIYLLTEKSILSILNSIENKDLSILENKDFNLISKKLKLQLEDLIKSDILYKYDDIKFHKHALKNYSNHDGVMTLEVSSSLEFFYSKKNKDKYLDKSINKKQVRFLTKFVYITDSDSYEKDINVYGINCPNCGAVISSLNKKKCNYCKTILNIQVIDLIKCWKIIDCIEY